jgi:hypothetical protein
MLLSTTTLPSMSCGLLLPFLLLQATRPLCACLRALQSMSRLQGRLFTDVTSHLGLMVCAAGDPPLVCTPAFCVISSFA